MYPTPGDSAHFLYLARLPGSGQVQAVFSTSAQASDIMCGCYSEGFSFSFSGMLTHYPQNASLQIFENSQDLFSLQYSFWGAGET